MSNIAVTEPNRPGSHEEWSRALYHCLLPMLRELGWYGSEEQLNQVLPIDISRLDIYKVINSLAGMRVAVEESEMCLKDIDESMVPCIFVSHEGDPLVLLECNEFGFTVFNGRSKKKKVMVPQKITGSVLFLKFIEVETPTLFDAIPNWFLNVVKRFKNLLTFGMFVSMAISLLTISAPLLVMFLFSEISVLEQEASIRPLAFGVAIYVVTLFGFRILRTFALSYVSSRIGNIVINQVMRRLFYLPPPYTEMASLGAQLSRIRDFDSIKGFIAGSTMGTLMELPFILLIVFLIFLIDPRTALVPIVAVVIFCVFGVIAKYWSKAIGGEFSGSSKDYNDFVMDTLTNIRVVKSLALGRLWTKKYRDLLSSSIFLNLRSSSFHSIVLHFSSALVSLAGLVTVVVGVDQILNGEMSPAGLMASIMLTWRILTPIKAGFTIAVQYDKVSKSIEQVDRLMELKTETRSSDSVSVTADLSGDIVFSQVSLRYTKEAHPALLGISFAINPGETLVIIGHGGSGTSSILKLMMGMYLPQAGRVIIDGNNLQQIDPISLRRQIAYMPEKPFFFNGTLRENMMLKSPLASEENLQFAINESGLQQEISSLPLGLDTPFNNANMKYFSVSFQRRFSLALMLIKESSLWLIDNPSAGMEDIHERRILSTLEGAKGMATIVIATKNPDYLGLADKVLWLDGGRMKSFGTLQEISMGLKGQKTS